MQKFEKGIAMLVGGQVIWGISPVFIGQFLDDVPASLVLTIRHLISGILFVAVLLVLAKGNVVRTRGQLLTRQLLVWGVLTSGLAELLWVRAILDAGVIISILLVRLEIPFAVIFAAWYLGEKITPSIALAAGLSIGGAVLLTQVRGGIFDNPQLLIGVIEALAGALIWTWAGVYAKKMLTDGTSAILLGALRSWIGAVFNGAIVVLSIGAPFAATTVSLTRNQWFVIVYLAIFASVIGMLFYYKGMEYTSASVAAVMLSVSLLISTVGGLIIGEQLAPLQWVGAVMVLSAIGIASNVHGSFKRMLNVSGVSS